MPTPYLTVDLGVVRARVDELRAALPQAHIHYAVKANPAPQLLSLLVKSDISFDVASVGEIETVLRQGADPARLCYGNPLRSASDVAAAARHGVRRFVTDSADDLAVLAEQAPGADVLVRLAVDEAGAATPFGQKFGCSPAGGVQLLRHTGALGLTGAGLAFHVGSQQLRPAAFASAIGLCAEVADTLSTDSGGSRISVLNIGGGFPVEYREPVPDITEYAAAITAALGEFPGGRTPELVIEPGRFLVADAGVLSTSVLRVGRRDGGARWVYLDVGRYGGLAETEGEAITYRVRTPHDDGPVESAVLAGPTCDGDDVLYRDIPLPTALRAGDVVELLAAGAYTASYSSVGFNGIPPLAVRCIDGDDTEPGDGGRSFAGRHVLAELSGMDPGLLDDEAALGRELGLALGEAGATVLQIVPQRFAPQGVTVLAVLAESHASVHTWPEHGSAFADIFTCGDSADPDLAVSLLARRLGAQGVTSQSIPRGAPTAGGESVRTGGTVVEPTGAGLRRVWDVSEVLWSGRTALQRVLIGRTAHGVTLFCDDERQSSEASQLVYHEALLVPALLLADAVDRVLIIGSSEGVASQLAVAAGAAVVDHVDLDEECVRLCSRLLPYGYTAAELAAAERNVAAGTGPVRMHYRDGWEFLRTTSERYDVVVVDLPDERPDEPEAQHNRLYEVDFLRLASGVLRPGGVLTGQVGCPTLWRNDTLRSSVRRYRSVFPTVVHYGSDEHEWSFLSGVPAAVADPVARMTARLAELPYRPVSIDVEALARGAVLPRSLRGPAEA